MPLLDRVNDRLAGVSRSDPVTLEEFGYLLGRGAVNKSRSGVTVGPTRALGLSAWYRGVSWLSNSVASLPVHTYRGDYNDRNRRSDPPWLMSPDVEMPWFGLVEHWMMSILHRGNAYAYKLRDPVGRVTGLRAVHPDRVRVGQASDGTKVFELDGRQDVGYTRRDILHIPGLSYNGIVGLDPISIHAESLGIAAASDEFAARSFGQGTHLQAYITVPNQLTQPQADQLKSQWKRFHQGLANAHEFGVLGNGAEYKTLSLTPEQAQLLETRRYGVTEIARILGVVPHKLYDLDRATFSNIEQQAIESVTDGPRAWCVRFEAYLRDDPDLMPPKNFVEFQLEGLLRGDTITRYSSYGTAIDKGFMTPATAARLENLPAPPEIEYYQRPLNVAVIREGQPDQVPQQQPAQPMSPATPSTPGTSTAAGGEY